MTALDETHDPARTSWVDSANGHRDFPIQNLPLGIFSVGGGEPRIGVAIGDMIVDIRGLAEAGLLDDRWLPALTRPNLNDWFAHGPDEGARAAPLTVRPAVGRGAARRGRAAPRRAVATPRCTCRARSATTPISTSAFITRPTSAASSAPTSRCCPTISMCRSAIMAAPRRCGCRASRWCGPRASARRPTPKRPNMARRGGSIMSLSLACSSAAAMRLGRRSRSGGRATISPAIACSTTGRRAISRRGNISRSGRSLPRISSPAFRRG